MGNEVLCMAPLAIRMAGGGMPCGGILAPFFGDSHCAKYHGEIAIQTATGYSVGIYQSPARRGVRHGEMAGCCTSGRVLHQYAGFLFSFLGQ